MKSDQKTITHFFKSSYTSCKAKSSVYNAARYYNKRSRQFLNRYRHQHDAMMTENGYAYCASRNFSDYHVYITQDDYITIDEKEIFTPQHTRIGIAIIDADSALEHISVETGFRGQGIGTTLVKFINKYDKQFHAYAGAENNSRYRLTEDGRLSLHMRRKFSFNYLK